MSNGFDPIEFEDNLREYLDGEPSLPYAEWVRNEVCPQIMPLDDELDVHVEVVSVYPGYDSIESGDNIVDAPGELSQIGETFVDVLEDYVDEDVELIAQSETSNAQGASVKLYRAQVDF